MGAGARHRRRGTGSHDMRAGLDLEPAPAVRLLYLASHTDGNQATMLTTDDHKVTSPVTSLGVTWLALFTTTGTLVCCALPITLVALGMGATMASLVSSVPFLVTLSQYKVAVFTVSGMLIGASGWLLYRSGRECPADPELAAMCERTQKWNRRVWWTSVGLWCIGFYAAFLALPLTIWLEG